MSRKKRRNKKYKGRFQRRTEYHLTPKSVKMLKRPFYFAAYRKPSERMKHDVVRPKMVKKVLYKAALSKALINSNGKRSTKKHTPDRARTVLHSLYRRYVCASRKARRQALFKTGRAGRGKSGPIIKKIAESSKVRC